MFATRVVEERPREARPPRFEYGLELSTIDVRPQPRLEKVDDSATRDGSLDREVGARVHGEDQGPLGVYADGLPSANELPWVRRSIDEAPPQAVVFEQIPRMLRSAPTLEIRRRRGSRDALEARPDGDRDHVLFNPLFEADSSVIALRYDIDETLLGGHVDGDVGVLREKRRHDARQHEARSHDRDVEPQTTRRAIPEVVHHVERGLNLVERRAEPFEQARARLGQRDAPGSAGQQAHAETLLESSDCITQARWTRTRRPGRPTKPACAGNGYEGVEIG